MDELERFRQKLDRWFGPGSWGDSVKSRAMSSKKVFVRSQDQLSDYKPGVKGLIMSARDLYEAFGPSIFDKLDDGDGTVCIFNTPQELKAEREKLGLTLEGVAQRINSFDNNMRPDPTPVIDAEDINTRTSIHTIHAICIALGLDVRSVGKDQNAIQS